MVWILAPKNEHKRWRTSNYFYDFYVCVHAQSLALPLSASLDWDTSASEWNLFNTKLIYLVSCISVHSLTNTHTHEPSRELLIHFLSVPVSSRCTWMVWKLWALTKPTNFILFYILTRSIIIFPELYHIKFAVAAVVVAVEWLHHSKCACNCLMRIKWHTVRAGKKGHNKNLKSTDSPAVHQLRPILHV